MRLFAIGDIHGHCAELIGLMSQLLKDGMVPERDTVVFLGDYVDGGPDTREVIESLSLWSRKYPQWVFIRGNHDQMMIDALDHPEDAGTFYHWYH